MARPGASHDPRTGVGVREPRDLAGRRRVQRGELKGQSMPEPSESAGRVRSVSLAFRASASYTCGCWADLRGQPAWWQSQARSGGGGAPIRVFGGGSITGSFRCVRNGDRPGGSPVGARRLLFVLA